MVAIYQKYDANVKKLLLLSSKIKIILRLFFTAPPTFVSLTKPHF